MKDNCDLYNELASIVREKENYIRIKGYSVLDDPKELEDIYLQTLEKNEQHIYLKLKNKKY